MGKQPPLINSGTKRFSTFSKYFKNNYWKLHNLSRNDVTFDTVFDAILINNMPIIYFLILPNFLRWPTLTPYRRQKSAKNDKYSPVSSKWTLILQNLDLFQALSVTFCRIWIVPRLKRLFRKNYSPFWGSKLLIFTVWL